MGSKVSWVQASSTVATIYIATGTLQQVNEGLADAAISH